MLRRRTNPQGREFANVSDGFWLHWSVLYSNVGNTYSLKRAPPIRWYTHGSENDPRKLKRCKCNILADSNFLPSHAILKQFLDYVKCGRAHTPRVDPKRRAVTHRSFVGRLWVDPEKRKHLRSNLWILNEKETPVVYFLRVYFYRKWNGCLQQSTTCRVSACDCTSH